MAQTKKISKLHLLLPLLWMVVIFMLSHQSASISSGQSGVFVEQLRHIAPSVDQQLLTFLVRKGAHIFAYFVLGILTFNALWRLDLSKFKFNYPVGLSIIVCALYATSDEFHQLFVSGRSGEIRDIIIDSCAATVGVFIISIFVRILQKSKK